MVLYAFYPPFCVLYRFRVVDNAVRVCYGWDMTHIHFTDRHSHCDWDRDRLSWLSSRGYQTEIVFIEERPPVGRPSTTVFMHLSLHGARAGGSWEFPIGSESDALLFKLTFGGV